MVSLAIIMSSFSCKVKNLSNLGFCPDLAARALRACHDNPDDAIEYCLNMVQANIGRYRIAQAEQPLAHNEVQLLRMTHDASTSPYTSYIGVSLENISPCELSLHLTEVLLHRVGLDSVDVFHSEQFKIQTPSGHVVDPTFRIDLDPLEVRDYTVIVQADYETDVDFIVTASLAKGRCGEYKTEGRRCHLGTSRPGRTATRTTLPLTSLENVRDLHVGQRHYVSQHQVDGAGCAGLELYYERLSWGDLQIRFHGRYPLHGSGKNCLEGNAPVSGATYGTTCPSCGGTMEELERYTSSDGMMGICRDLWACAKEGCGIIRVCNYEGYGQV